MSSSDVGNWYLWPMLYRYYRQSGLYNRFLKIPDIELRRNKKKQNKNDHNRHRGGNLSARYLCASSKKLNHDAPGNGPVFASTTVGDLYIYI